jgi:hypothetical protein
MVLEFFRLSQGNQDSERHEAALLGIEDVTRPDLAKNELHPHRSHGRSEVARVDRSPHPFAALRAAQPGIDREAVQDTLACGSEFSRHVGA